MNHSLTPPSERELPNRQRRRAELLAAISAPPEPSHRKVFVPLIAAASVLSLTAGGAAVAQMWQSQDDLPLRGTPDRNSPKPTKPATSTKPAKSAPPERTGIQSPPPFHELTDRELRAECEGESASGWEPVFGLEWQGDYPAHLEKTSVISRNGDRYMPGCGSGHYGLKSYPDFVRALVDPEEGRYIAPVTQVTYQYKDGPETEAVMRSGFAHFPEYEHWEEWTYDVPPDSKNPSGEVPWPPDNNLIGVSPGYRIRGYDAEGDLVYDSKRDGPFADECYTDPNRTEVVTVGSVENPTPETCIRTREWRP